MIEVSRRANCELMPAMTSGSDPTLEGLPLTERVLARLGRPRAVWTMLWAIVPLLSPVLFVPALRASGYVIGEGEVPNLLLTQLALVYADLVFLVGMRLLVRHASRIRGELPVLAPGIASHHLFSGVASTAGPLVATTIVTAFVTATQWFRYGWLPTLVSLPLQFVYLLPILTLVWVYLVILVDIDNLGRQPLTLDLFPQDRTLGLQDVGAAASAGLGLVLVAAAPVLLAGSDEPVTLVVGLAIVAI